MKIALELLGLNLKVIPVEWTGIASCWWVKSRAVTLALRINSSYVCFDVLASSGVQNKPCKRPKSQSLLTPSACAEGSLLFSLCVNVCKRQIFKSSNQFVKCMLTILRADAASQFCQVLVMPQIATWFS